jgi:hypothetical protein
LRGLQIRDISKETVLVLGKELPPRRIRIRTTPHGYRNKKHVREEVLANSVSQKTPKRTAPVLGRRTSVRRAFADRQPLESLISASEKYFKSEET